MKNIDSYSLDNLKNNILQSIAFLELILTIKQFDLQSISNTFENITLNTDNSINNKVILFNAFVQRNITEYNDIPLLTIFQSNEKDNLLLLLKTIIKDFNNISCNKKNYEDLSCEDLSCKDLSDDMEDDIESDDKKFPRFQDKRISIKIKKVLNNLFGLNITYIANHDKKTHTLSFNEEYRYLEILNDITNFLIKKFIDAISLKVNEKFSNLSTIDLFTNLGDDNSMNSSEDPLINFLLNSKLEFFKKNIEVAVNKIIRHTNKSLDYFEKEIKPISATKLCQSKEDFISKK